MSVVVESKSDNGHTARPFVSVHGAVKRRKGTNSSGVDSKETTHVEDSPPFVSQSFVDTISSPLTEFDSERQRYSIASDTLMHQDSQNDNESLE